MIYFNICNILKIILKIIILHFFKVNSFYNALFVFKIIFFIYIKWLFYAEISCSLIQANKIFIGCRSEIERILVKYDQSK